MRGSNVPARKSLPRISSGSSKPSSTLEVGSLEGNKQEQADFLAKRLVKTDPARVRDLHLAQSVLAQFENCCEGRTDNPKDEAAYQVKIPI